MKISELINGKEVFNILDIRFELLAELFKRGMIHVYDKNGKNIEIIGIEQVCLEYENPDKFDWNKYKKLKAKCKSPKEIENAKIKCIYMEEVNYDRIYINISDEQFFKITDNEFTQELCLSLLFSKS